MKSYTVTIDSVCLRFTSDEEEPARDAAKELMKTIVAGEGEFDIKEVNEITVCVTEKNKIQIPQLLVGWLVDKESGKFMKYADTFDGVLTPMDYRSCKYYSSCGNEDNCLACRGGFEQTEDDAPNYRGE